MKIIWTKILKFLEFLILKNFSRILEKFHFSISISRHFHFTFHSRSRSWDIFISLFTLDLDIKAFSFHFSFSKWVKLIFISLFTSRNEWTRFSFHFSLLELPISTLAGHWGGCSMAFYTLCKNHLFCNRRTSLRPLIVSRNIIVAQCSMFLEIIEHTINWAVLKHNCSQELQKNKVNLFPFQIILKLRIGKDKLRRAEIEMT